MSRRSEKEEAAHLQYETEHTDPGKSPSVLPYLAILVAAAFLLLIMAYFMQRRTAESVQGLHDSVSSFQTIDQLLEDNRTLREEVERLAGEQAELQSQLDAANAQLSTINATQDKAAQRLTALNQLNQLRALYNDRKYKDARAVLEAAPDLESTLRELTQDMTQEELAVYDPLAAYQKLVSLLG